jgi:hypothetical protein
MKCATHQKQEAIGVCKWCQRGVCSACVDERNTINGIYCSDNCSEISQSTDKLIARNVGAHADISIVHWAMMFGLFSAAAIMAIRGISGLTAGLTGENTMLLFFSFLLFVMGLAYLRWIISTKPFFKSAPQTEPTTHGELPND